MLTGKEIRQMFIKYFESKGHTHVASSSLVPYNDPTLLFTNAGMNQFKDVFLGLEKRDYTRATTSQKCVRAGGKHNDLDTVGRTARHHTFFEMLGNFSFGDYFKRDAIINAWGFLTEELKLPIDKLYITIYKDDDEAYELWRELTPVPEERIIRLGEKDNFWQMGETGPCGPCSEIHIDRGEEHACNHPDGCALGVCDCDRWLEIWNLVFMQYDRDANGNLTPLPQKNVDTGAGLERWAAILQNKLDNYDTDLFVNLKRAVSDITGVAETPENVSSFKVITDHLRSVGFAIADGVIPSNTDRGYVIRRILRRAMRHGQMLGHRGALLSKLYPALITEMGGAYPELAREQNRVVEILQNEENSFSDMLQNGMKLLENEIPKLNNNVLPGDIAFKLFDTYGFPLDLTQMILRDKNIDVDVTGFEKSMAEQKERSRANTKGTRIFWESQTDLPDTDDTAKYAPVNMESRVLSILRNGEFVKTANAGDEVEVALDKTNFYGTQGGQTGDSGELKSGDNTVMTVAEAARVDNVVIHKGVLTSELSVGDMVSPLVNPAIRQQTARAHTATHLLQAALRHVLNEDVAQRGSKVSPDSVRFDFSFGRAMTAEEKQAVEDLINSWIASDMPVLHEEMSMDDAKKRGAMALFGEKYGDVVRVITAGDVSCELCGGTHIHRTGEILKARINKEKSISSGIRRITMSVGTLAE